MKPSLLVLDQWGSADVQAGTSKNWLYKGFSESFQTRVVNADTAADKKNERNTCLFRALMARPFDLRREFHRQLEWAPKYPAAFEARTARFQRALDSESDPPAAYFQVGCLFGPVEAPGTCAFSYHDQTVAMVERDWPLWLPRQFSRIRDRFYELESASLRAKDLIFTYSEHTRSSMIADYGIAPDRVVVAPTACKIDFPDADDVLGPRRDTLLFASTDFDRKGGDWVFEAFTALRRKHPDLELVLVGGGATLPLPDGARHLGLVSFDVLRRQYLSASLIVHPARHDAYPNVLKEALACGLPAVASASAGIPEIIRDGVTGVILDQPGAATLAEAVDELLGDPARLDGMRRNCLEERERFRPETCVERMASAMTGVLNAKNGGSGV